MSAVASVRVEAIPTSKTSFFLPLNKLVLAPDQVRQEQPTGIPEMAAMLAAQGQLNALQVSKDPDSDNWFVHAGGRRLRGFHWLLKKGRIEQDHPVECKEVDEQDATAVGLMENISQ